MGHIVGFFAVIYLAYLVVKWVILGFRHFGRWRTAEDFTLTGEDDPVTLPRSFPWSQDWERRRRLWSNTRKAESGENFLDFFSDTSSVRIWMPIERRVSGFTIILLDLPRLPIRSIVLKLNGQEVSADLAGKVYTEGLGRRIQVDLDQEPALTDILITYEDPGREFNIDVQVQVLKGDKDLELIHNATSAAEQGLWDLASDYLHRYEQITATNPLVCYYLGQYHSVMKDWPRMQEYGMRLFALNRPDQGFEIFSHGCEQTDWILDEGILNRLKKEASEWELPAHQGLVTLRREIRLHFLKPGSLWEHNHFVLEIRRRAAARKFRSITFSWDASNTYMLRTGLRIRRVNGEEETVPSDRFSRGDADDDDRFLPVQRREGGTWILPDLNVGDVVEYFYDCVKQSGKGPGDFFHLESLSDPYLPTVEGQVEVFWPPDEEFEFVARNSDTIIKEEKKPLGEDRATRFTIRRHHTKTISGSPYQGWYRNPTVAVARKGPTWSELAGHLDMEETAGQWDEQVLPEEIARLVDDAPDPATALRQGFYWVRDRIKYGALETVQKEIREKNRAALICERRIGDCKDKTFLLELICRRLDIRCQQLLVSVRNGMIVPELPANQFDHVLLRAEIDGRWVYLDATTATHTFGNIPAFLQGLQGLVIGDGGRLTEIPTDRMENNRIEIVERLGLEEDVWLTSAVEMKVSGVAGRQLDEIWKFQSLTRSDENRAMKSTLENFLPGLTVADFERLDDTGSSDTCHIRLNCRRAKLTSLADRKIAMCEVTIPTLPFHNYREEDLGDEFAFFHCLSVLWRMEVAPDARAAFQGFSRIQDCDFGFGKVSHLEAEAPAGVTMTREIEVAERLVSGDQLAQLPAFFDAAEDFERVVLEFG